jgi:hypothetical protein
LFRAITFDIEFSGDDLLNFSYIIVPDMTFIGAGMNRNPIGAETLCINSCFYHVRIISAAGISQSCKLVDVN